MKLTRHRPIPSRVRAFTLAEMLITVMIFSFIVAAICAVQLYALRIYTLGSTKLTATTQARQSLNQLRELIRSSKIVYVGTYTNGSTFTRLPVGQLQIGNALEFATTNGVTTNYMIYYLDNWDPTNTLFSISNYVASTLRVQARYVTNYYCFYGENYAGATNTDYENNTVIYVCFNFYRWEYPLGFVGSNALNAYDFYHIQTKVMRRAYD